MNDRAHFSYQGGLVGRVESGLVIQARDVGSISAEYSSAIFQYSKENSMLTYKEVESL